jgi:hypothetical protein
VRLRKRNKSYGLGTTNLRNSVQFVKFGVKLIGTSNCVTREGRAKPGSLDLLSLWEDP